MAIYEVRTYKLYVGKMDEATELYTEFGYPALQSGGQDAKLLGYFQADTGTINQLVQLWKFDDDNDGAPTGPRFLTARSLLRASLPSFGHWS